jgi:hypothetical protein
MQEIAPTIATSKPIEVSAYRTKCLKMVFLLRKGLRNNNRNIIGKKAPGVKGVFVEFY